MRPPTKRAAPTGCPLNAWLACALVSSNIVTDAGGAVPMTVGVVQGLRRYPVKSMLGEDLTRGDFDVRGLTGDRAFAVVDRTGVVGSVKHPRKWGPLLQCRARWTGTGSVDVTLADGSTYESGSTLLNQRLSALLGRPVSVSGTPPQRGVLERAVPDYVGGLPEALAARAVMDDTGTAITSGHVAEGTFFDFGAVHLVTTGGLDSLRTHHPTGDVDARRFRPNLIVETWSGAPFPEDGWLGATLRIGSAVFRVVVPTPRCVVPTLAHDELPADPDLMRMVAREHRVNVLHLGALSCVGVYLSVVEPGTARIGDDVVVAESVSAAV